MDTGKDDPRVDVWFARIHKDEDNRKAWESAYRVDDCYSFWQGRQRSEPLDLQCDRKAQTNLIHPQVRAQLPQLYFYRPFGRVLAEPARSDTPASELPERSRLLQDTGNYFVRNPDTRFRASTFLALKEQFWAFGCVEVGHSVDFIDNPQLGTQPPLKEDDETKVEEGEDDITSVLPPELRALMPPMVPPPAAPPVPPMPSVPGLLGQGLPATPLPPAPVAVPPPVAPPGLPALPVLPGLPPAPAPGPSDIDAELARLQSQIRSESFYVKFISAKQVMVSASDKAILEENDWVGYWEDYNLEDVKRARIYKNTENLKPSVPATDKDERDEQTDTTDSQFREASVDGKTGGGTAEAATIRLYKIWDLRTKTKIVLADGHKQVLLAKRFKRCPLKFLRPDIDPYHFRPVPPVYNGLDPQEMHNNSLEYLRKTEKQTKARWTYDAGAVKPEDAEKFERDEANYIPRRDGTMRPFEPIEHPQYTQLPLQLLALSEHNFAQATGVPAESRQSETAGDKTATQVMVQNTAAQIVDSFDRATVAEWLASIIEELILLAKDHMVLSRWIAMHVDRESPMALVESLKVAKTYQQIKAEDLENATNGITWHVAVDVESISPVAEQEQLQRLLQMLNFIGNPMQALLLSKAPMLLDRLLELAGLKGGRDRDAILEALNAIVAYASASMQTGAGQPAGMSPMPGLPSPAARVPTPPMPTPPAAPGPAGPVSSVPAGRG